MKLQSALIIPAFFLLLFFSGCTNSNKKEYVKIEGFTQGGTYHVICNIPNGVRPKAIKKVIEQELTAIDNSLSGYNKKSILAKINDGEDVPLDDIFIEAFTVSKQIWYESNGAFDPSASPLFDIWGFGFKHKSLVTKAKIDSILQFVGMDKVYLEKRDTDSLIYIVKADPRITFNFNALAQGLTCDLVARKIEETGCSDYLVEVGREIVCKGESPRGGNWRIGLDKPFDGNFDEGKELQDIITVTDRGIVTSGNYRQYYVENGEKYAHTIDPVSGYPVKHNLLSATVIAKNGTIADAYATWFMVIGLEAAQKIVSDRSDIEVYLVYGAQDDMKSWQTDSIMTTTEINNE